MEYENQLSSLAVAGKNDDSIKSTATNWSTMHLPGWPIEGKNYEIDNITVQCL